MISLCARVGRCRNNIAISSLSSTERITRLVGNTVYAIPKGQILIPRQRPDKVLYSVVVVSRTSGNVAMTVGDSRFGKSGAFA